MEKNNQPASKMNVWREVSFPFPNEKKCTKPQRAEHARSLRWLGSKSFEDKNRKTYGQKTKTVKKITPPKKGVLVSSGMLKDKLKFLKAAQILNNMNIR